jgi:hypothetical protein
VEFDFDVETDTTEALAEEMAEALNLDSNEQMEVRHLVKHGHFGSMTQPVGLSFKGLITNHSRQRKPAHACGSRKRPKSSSSALQNATAPGPPRRACIHLKAERLGERYAARRLFAVDGKSAHDVQVLAKIEYRVSEVMESQRDKMSGIKKSKSHATLVR